MQPKLIVFSIIVSYLINTLLVICSLLFLYLLIMISRVLNHHLPQLSLYIKIYSFSQLNKKPDLYTLLQLAPNAKPDQIRYNYFKLISKYQNKGSQNHDQAKHSKLLNQAYVILSNQKLKAKYDKEKGYGQPTKDQSTKEKINLSKEQQMSQKYNEARRGFSAIVGDQKTRIQQRLIAAVMISAFVMTLFLVLNGKNYKNNVQASSPNLVSGNK